MARARQSRSPREKRERVSAAERAAAEGIARLEAVARSGPRDDRAQALALLAMRASAEGSETDFARAAEHIAKAASLARTTLSHGRVAHARGHLAHHRANAPWPSTS